MSTGALVAFLGVAAVAYVTPGPDWFVVMRHAAASRRHGAAAAAGALSGLVAHATAAAVGVAAILLASAQAFAVVKLVGAAYLVYLGIKALRAGRQRQHDQDHAEAGTLGSAYRAALLTNLLNPKAVLFFMAVLPQFIDPGTAALPQIALLGVLDIGLGVLWWSLFVPCVAGISRAMGTERARVVLDRVAGVVLIGFGAGLAVTPQPRRT